MKRNERREAILKKLNEAGRIKVSELSEELYFSEMTIRRDLVDLEMEGFLRRVHGGAVKNVLRSQYPVDYRINFSKDEKRELAKRAIKYLGDNQVVFFNSSSTLAYITPYLTNYKNIKIVTNSVYLLSIFEQMHIPCYLTGGKYDEIEKCLSGRQTEKFLRGINPDVAFLSCEAISDDGFITDSDPSLAEIAKIAIKKSKFSVLLMDKSKIGTVCTYDICHTDQLTDVILL